MTIQEIYELACELGCENDLVTLFTDIDYTATLATTMRPDRPAICMTTHGVTVCTGVDGAEPVELSVDEWRRKIQEINK